MPPTLEMLAPNLQIAGLFFLTLLPLCLIMKMVAFRGTPESNDWILLLSPFPTPMSVKRSLSVRKGPRLILRFLVAFGACVCAYWLYWKFFPDSFALPILRSYWGAIVLWLVSETLGSLIPFLGIPSGRLLPLPHGAAPPLATSVSDFWGRRWNVWTSDWFRQVIFRPLQRRPVLALMLVFLASGVFHEWVINVPLYVVSGRNCFGSMIIYFLLQAFGILIERRIRNRGARVVLVWLFVFGAAPLIVNEGLLRILGLWPET